MDVSRGGVYKGEGGIGVAEGGRGGEGVKGNNPVVSRQVTASLSGSSRVLGGSGGDVCLNPGRFMSFLFKLHLRFVCVPIILFISVYEAYKSVSLSLSLFHIFVFLFCLENGDTLGQLSIFMLLLSIFIIFSCLVSWK